MVSMLTLFYALDDVVTTAAAAKIWTMRHGVI